MINIDLINVSWRFKVTKASLAQHLRLEVMEEVRGACDRAEAICPQDLWPLATYKELLFLDQTHHTTRESSSGSDA